jgi:hypothetical protein
VATAASVLGFVTGGLTALGSLGFLIAALSGGDDGPTVLLVLGLPCAAGLITGATWLLGRRRPDLLFWSALAAVAVLLLALVVGLATLSGDDAAGLGVFVFLALSLPVLTAVYARLPGVTGWVGAGRPQSTGVPPSAW